MRFLEKLSLDKQKKIALRVADIETDKNGELLDIGYYDENGYKIFSDWETFIDFLPCRSRVFFHAGGSFDMVNALYYLTENRAWSASLSGSRIVNLTFTEKNISFCDSFAIFQNSLKKLGVAFGCQKIKLDIDDSTYADMGVFKKNQPQLYNDYLQNDCETLYEILQKAELAIFENYGLKNLAITTGSLAFRVFKAKFLAHEIYLPNELEDNFLRQGYFGGSVQYVGDGVLSVKKVDNKEVLVYDNVTIIDINSMYAWAMLGLIPTGVLYKARQKSDCYRNGKICAGMYNVSFSVPPESTKYPIFICGIEEHSYYFGYSSENTFLTGEDLELIEELGGFWELKSGLYCIETSPCFEDYINFHYTKKANASSDAEYEIMKKLLVNLYGKTGQKFSREIVAKICLGDSTDEKICRDYNKENGTSYESVYENIPEILPDCTVLYEEHDYEILKYTQKTRYEKIESNVLIAAYITARGRRKIRLAMCQYNTIYSDTDSIFFQGELKHTVSKKLGDFSIVDYKDKITAEKIPCIDVMVDVRGRKNYTVYTKNFDKVKHSFKGCRDIAKLDENGDVLIDEKTNTPIAENHTKILNVENVVGFSHGSSNLKSWLKDPTKSPSVFKVTKKNNKRQPPK